VDSIRSADSTTSHYSSKTFDGDASCSCSAPSYPVLNLDHLEDPTSECASWLSDLNAAPPNQHDVQMKVRAQVARIIAGVEAKKSFWQSLWDLFTFLPVVGWAMRALLGPSQAQQKRAEAKEMMLTLKQAAEAINERSFLYADSENALDMCGVLLELFTVATIFADKIESQIYVSQSIFAVIRALAKYQLEQLFVLSDEGRIIFKPELLGGDCSEIKHTELFELLENQVSELTICELSSLVNNLFIKKGRAVDNAGRALATNIIIQAAYEHEAAMKHAAASSASVGVEYKQSYYIGRLREIIASRVLNEIRSGASADYLIERLAAIRALDDCRILWNVALIALKFDRHDLLAGLASINFVLEEHKRTLLELSLDCYVQDINLVEIGHIKISALESIIRHYDVFDVLEDLILEENDGALIQALPVAFWVLPTGKAKRLMTVLRDSIKYFRNNFDKYDAARMCAEHSVIWNKISEVSKSALREVAKDRGIPYRLQPGWRQNTKAIRFLQDTQQSTEYELLIVDQLYTLCRIPTPDKEILIGHWERLNKIAESAQLQLAAMIKDGVFRATDDLVHVLQRERQRILNLINLNKECLQACLDVLTPDAVSAAVRQRLDSLQRDYLVSLWPIKMREEYVNPELKGPLFDIGLQQTNTLRMLENSHKACIEQMPPYGESAELLGHLLLLSEDCHAADITMIVRHWIVCKHGTECIAGLNTFEEHFHHGVVNEQTLQAALESSNWGAMGWLLARLRQDQLGFKFELILNMLQQQDCSLEDGVLDLFEELSLAGVDLRDKITHQKVIDIVAELCCKSSTDKFTVQRQRLIRCLRCIDPQGVDALVTSIHLNWEKRSKAAAYNPWSITHWFFSSDDSCSLGSSPGDETSASR